MPLRLEESQAAAAVGQIRLAHAYKELLEANDVTVAQVLLTLEDSERRRRYLNARATLESLLALGALPVINENDTVATAEIRYGDNDRLAARVAQMASADCLVLLSDVEGLYSADPEPRPRARASSARCARSPRRSRRWRAARLRSFGSGGMSDQDPRRAHRGGRRLSHVYRRRRHTRIRCGASRRARDCTWFVPTATPAAARKQWIAGTLRPAGALTIDAGALRALLEGKSLLPAGVTAARGRFERGDTVSVLTADGSEIARGIVAYSDADAARIMGRRSSEIAETARFSRPRRDDPSRRPGAAARRRCGVPLMPTAAAR